MKTPVLHTERMILRPPTVEDAPALQKHFDNPAVIGNLSKQVPWPYPPDGAVRFLEDVLLPQLACGDGHAWVLTEKARGDELIGLLHFRCASGEAGHRGFWLAEPWWGRGLMTEAVVVTQDWLFFELGIDELIAYNAPSNPASRRIKEKTGAVFVREIDLASHHDSRAEEWRVTREAWSAFGSR